MFGWFQIGKIIKLGDNPSWYLKEKPNPSSHPHTIGKWKKNNTLYIAKKNLEGFELKNFPGFGKFKATKMTNLTNLKKSLNMVVVECHITKISLDGKKIQ